MAKGQANTFSGQLRAAIAASGESLCRIAAGCGVNDGILSRFMRDERSLTTRTVDRLCTYLRLELRQRSGKER